jgi:hypothetical protein
MRATLLLAALLAAGCNLRPLSLLVGDGGGSLPPDAAGGDGGGVLLDGGGRPDGAPLILDGGVVCVPAPETCNGLDDDCNGVTDDVDPARLQGDPNNCGQCGRACVLPHANGSCVAGACVFACQSGWKDANQDVPGGVGASDGCECQVTHGGVEVCDGLDNDCNGLTDDGVLPGVGEPCFPDQGCPGGVCKGECRPGVAACRNGALACDGARGPAPEECDGRDNDCNGFTDDGLVPQPCFTATAGCDLATGACHGICQIGVQTCRGADGWSACAGEIGPQPEVCNGQDDDCNGQTDDGALPGVGETCFPAAGCPLGNCRGDCHAGATQCVSGGLACVGAQGPTPELCDGHDNDCDGQTDNGFVLASDVHNCGACGNDCTNLAQHPESQHAIAYCDAGSCRRTCEAGWWDADDDFAPGRTAPRNGCEYRCDYTGPEVCDGQDNDCDGLTDTDDPTLLLPAAGFCKSAGACAGAQPACERYTPPGPAESGDALDQLDQWDLHGATDGNTSAGVLYVTLAAAGGTTTVSLYADAPHTLLVAQGARPGDGVVTLAEQNGSGLGGSVQVAYAADTSAVTLAVPITTWVCGYGPDVELAGLNQIAPDETRCDGIDNDCDGLTDETFPLKGTACDNGLAGVCRGTGHYQCVSGGTATACVIEVPGQAPSAETCDGLDNDCDGIVDNPSGPGRVVDDMVEVGSPDGGLHFWIYRYEASRPGATAASGGTATHRACSQADVLPWTLVSYADAAAACAAAGKRLCTAAEYSLACGGSANLAYPYGPTYDPAACNGVNRAPDGGVPDGGVDPALLPTGALPACVSPVGAYDMSGNAKEWTADRANNPDGGVPDGGAIYVVRGGAYDTPEPGLTCAFDWAREVGNVLLPTLGFRCCSDGAP